MVPNIHAPVQYDDTTGEMSFDVRNVGRGAAFGVTAQIRMGREPLGASIPGSAAMALAPGEHFLLRARLSEPSKRIRGRVVQAELSYYDITERWHRSVLTVVGRRPRSTLQDPAVAPELEVSKVFVSETDSYLGPILGSPQALDRRTREQRALRHRAGNRLAQAFRRNDQP